MLDQNVRINELDRLLGNVLRIGLVEELDQEKARARVRFGKELLTDWVPWLTERAGASGSFWNPPAVGEQVLLAALGGRLEMGVILGSLYQNTHPAPENNESAHTLELPETGTFKIKIGEAVLTLSKDGLTYSIGKNGAGEDIKALKLTASQFTSDATMVKFPKVGIS